MQLPFEVLVLYIGIVTVVFLVGVIMGIRKIAGAPFFCVVSGIMLFGIFAVPNTTLQVPSNLYNETINYSNSFPMNVTTSASTVTFSTTTTGLAERPVNVLSQLANKKINCIEVNLLKTGSPTDNVMIGILDNDNRMIKLFGNITASSLNTISRSYQVCLSSHDYWIIAYNDYVGVKHTTSSGGNTVSVSTDATNPFDGTNSVRATYTSGAWSDTAGTDLRMKLTSEELQIVKTPRPYTLQDNDEWVFLIVLSIFYIMIGVILQIQKWS